MFNPDDPQELKKAIKQKRADELEKLEERLSIQEDGKPEEDLTPAREIPECAKELLARFKGELAKKKADGSAS